jgi:hypothetical protein
MKPLFSLTDQISNHGKRERDRDRNALVARIHVVVLNTEKSHGVDGRVLKKTDNKIREKGKNTNKT